MIAQRVNRFNRRIAKGPKSDQGFRAKLSRRRRYKAAGNFRGATVPSATVRKKITENAVYTDVLAVSNPANAGFGQRGYSLTVNNPINYNFRLLQGYLWLKTVSKKISKDLKI